MQVDDFLVPGLVGWVDLLTICSGLASPEQLIPHETINSMGIEALLEKHSGTWIARVCVLAVFGSQSTVSWLVQETSNLCSLLEVARWSHKNCGILLGQDALLPDEVRPSILALGTLDS